MEPFSDALPPDTIAYTHAYGVASYAAHTAIDNNELHDAYAPPPLESFSDDLHRLTPVHAIMENLGMQPQVLFVPNNLELPTWHAILNRRYNDTARQTLGTPDVQVRDMQTVPEPQLWDVAVVDTRTPPRSRAARALLRALGPSYQNSDLIPSLDTYLSLQLLRIIDRQQLVGTDNPNSFTLLREVGYPATLIRSRFARNIGNLAISWNMGIHTSVPLPGAPCFSDITEPRLMLQRPVLGKPTPTLRPTIVGRKLA